MILANTPATLDMIVPLIVERVNALNIHERLYNTVDSKKKWDGKLDASQFSDKKTKYGNYECITCYVPLTYGALKFEVVLFSGAPTEYRSFTVSYHLPSVATRWHILYRNRLERQSGDSKALDNIKKFTKVVDDKINSLLKGIEDWYAEATINPQNYSKGPYFGNSDYTANFEYLVGAVGRVRMLSQMHADKAKACNIPTHGQRINELADEMLRLLMEQHDTVHNFKEACFSETY
jgi:hypothetical protein